MDRREVLRVLGAAAAVPFLSTATFGELLAVGRELRQGQPAGRPWLPRTLDPHQNETVIALADVILPETDTPAASAARVNEFVDLILTEWFDPEETDRFLTGLADLDARCRDTYGRDFVDCSEEERISVTATMDAEVQALREAPGGEPGSHFFFQMKRLTLAGFFTSEIGQEAVGWEAIPGELVGCTLLPGYR